jgi:hypothetical protein
MLAQILDGSAGLNLLLWDGNAAGKGGLSGLKLALLSHYFHEKIKVDRILPVYAN